jgi:hypothetical protein
MGGVWRPWARPPMRALLVELATQDLDLLIELVLFQDLIQAIVERITWRLNNRARCDPEILLSLKSFRVPIAMWIRRTKYSKGHMFLDGETTTTTGC